MEVTYEEVLAQVKDITGTIVTDLVMDLATQRAINVQLERTVARLEKVLLQTAGDTPVSDGMADQQP